MASSKLEIICPYCGCHFSFEVSAAATTEGGFSILLSRAGGRPFECNHCQRSLIPLLVGFNGCFVAISPDRPEPSQCLEVTPELIAFLSGEGPMPEEVRMFLGNG